MSASGKVPRKPSLLVRSGGFLAATLIRCWMSTLDFRVAFYDRSVDPALGIGGPRIYVFWHEFILFPLYLRGHCHLAMLLSQHRDAEVLARVAYHCGFDCIRGSTNRGGSRVVRELIEQRRRMHLAITPDGPRGPRRCLAPGAVYLASRLQWPLVPMGFAFDRPWRANSWDRFAIAKPYSRARALIGPPLQIARDLDRRGIEACRQRVERLLNCLTWEAAAWAESAHRTVGEVPVRPQGAPRCGNGSQTGSDTGGDTRPQTIPLPSSIIRSRVA